MSCSDYSLLMLIGPLVRRLAAAAPGVTIQVLPRVADPVRLLRVRRQADLVIEPARDHAGRRAAEPAAVRRPLGLLRLGRATAEVGERMTMETYLRLGHLVYSMGAGSPPRSSTATWRRSG